MSWISRAEYYPATQTELKIIKNQLENETFYSWKDKTSSKVSYFELSQKKQEELYIERITAFCKRTYKRRTKTEEVQQELIMCQREVPFYVETVRKFKDQRYKYKKLYKEALNRYYESESNVDKQESEILNGIQVAYKCVLNSFYGYVMRKGSRWFSLEMAAAVCNEGGKVIKEAKKFLEGICIPLELDTDGIWIFLPEKFPSVIEFNQKKIPFLQLLLNHFVCSKFTNLNHQTQSETGEFVYEPANSLYFELDGPYKSMIIPSSIEENRLLKKRYAVFDYNDNIVELKGFELKRRGELTIVKRLQEDLFEHFNDGNTLKECYESSARVCEEYLSIIYNKGEGLDDDMIFELFSESRSMSKNIDEYAGKKSNIISTANKLAEFLGNEVLKGKLKCEYIVSKYPQNEATSDRVIPVMIFKSEQKEYFLKKWLTKPIFDLKEIIDWDYYAKRLELIITKLIIIPATIQGLKNPLPFIQLPKWCKEEKDKGKLDFKTLSDIEDMSIPNVPIEPIKRVKNEIGLKTTSFRKYLEHVDKKWMEYYYRRIKGFVYCAKIEISDNLQYSLISAEGERTECQLISKIFVKFDPEITKAIKEIAGDGYNQETGSEMSKKYNEILKDDFKLSLTEVSEYYLPDIKLKQEVCEFTTEDRLSKCQINEILSRIAINFEIYNFINPFYQICYENEVEYQDLMYTVVSSFIFNKKPVFCAGINSSTVISEIRDINPNFYNLKSYRDKLDERVKIIVVNNSDISLDKIIDVFSGFLIIKYDYTVIKSLDNFDGLKKRQFRMHDCLSKKFQESLDISKLTNIPVLNIDDNLLDIMFYKELMKNRVLVTDKKEEYTSRAFNIEKYEKMYCSTRSVLLECESSLILAILNYDHFIKNSLYDRHEYEDFKVLKEMIRKIIVEKIDKKLKIRSLLLKLQKWLLKDSRIITNDLQELFIILHNSFMTELIKKLRSMQCKIVSVTNNLILIDTEKKDEESSLAFINYIRKKVTEQEGFKLLRLKALRTFEKLAYLSPNMLYYSNGIPYSFSYYKLPNVFLTKYFSEEGIANTDVYSLARQVSIDQLKVMIDLVGLQRSNSALENNCLKLRKIEHFNLYKKWYPSYITIYCNNCGFENRHGMYCIRCYSQIDIGNVENECLKYLNYIKNKIIKDEMICEKCNNYKHDNQFDFCRCGGHFIKKDYSNELSKLCSFVGTDKFKKEVETLNDYLNK